MLVAEGFNQLKTLPQHAVETLSIVPRDRQAAAAIGAVWRKGGDDRVSCASRKI